jgi:hypothetical protein
MLDKILYVAGKVIYIIYKAVVRRSHRTVVDHTEQS